MRGRPLRTWLLGALVGRRARLPVHPDRGRDPLLVQRPRGPLQPHVGGLHARPLAAPVRGRGAAGGADELAAHRARSPRPLAVVARHVHGARARALPLLRARRRRTSSSSCRSPRPRSCSAPRCSACSSRWAWRTGLRRRSSSPTRCSTSSYVVVTIRARLQGMDTHLEEAATDLGANEWTAFRKVTLPLIAPGRRRRRRCSRFALSVDDFVITNFTAGQTSTFPLFIWGAARQGVPAAGQRARDDAAARRARADGAQRRSSSAAARGRTRGDGRAGAGRSPRPASRSSVRILHVEHPDGGGPGVFGDVAPLETLAGVGGARRPAAELDAIVLYGGATNVVDAEHEPWLRDELAWLRERLDAGVPVLGALPRRAAARRTRSAPTVDAHEPPEIGWHAGRADRRRPRATRSSARCRSASCACQWHSWQFVAPRGRRAARRQSPACLQAFRHGRAWGVQFHPEVDAATLGALDRALRRRPRRRRARLRPGRGAAADGRADRRLERPRAPRFSAAFVRRRFAQLSRGVTACGGMATDALRLPHHRVGHPCSPGPPSVVALALDDPHRPRHRLDPGRPRGDHRRLRSPAASPRTGPART